MHPQLQAVIDEYESARRRLHSLAEEVPDQYWPHRPESKRWSVAECVAHLNLTSAAYLPILDEAIERGQRHGGIARRQYRRDALGWLLWKSAGPPVRFRLKTTAGFVPTSPDSRADQVAEFDRLQQEQMARVRNADGLPLDQLKIASPFDPRLKYNLYACLTILPRHQHRHLWQAEQAWRVVGRGRKPG